MRLLAGTVVAVCLLVGCGSSSKTTADAGTTSVPSTTVAASGEFAEYIGLTEAAAIAKADAADVRARVIERDGEKLQVTMDFDEERLNFVVVDGTVTNVTTG